MLIEIHAIQNHSPANLNRDDINAPKTCYFGGVLRSRISSQCIKRSIRMSDQFRQLLGGVRTRQLARLIAENLPPNSDSRTRAATILKGCGIGAKKEDRSDMLVYTTRSAIREMSDLLQNTNGRTDEELSRDFGRIIAERTAVPDMALTGRMLETGVLDNTTVEAALQVAHAFSTHEARPEVDYYVAADDIPGDDAGAGYVDEAGFASACFYKYFSVHWEKLVENLRGNSELAAHTLGAFIHAAALANPTGKQNSFAAHNPPDGMLVEFRATPLSYANAFAQPVTAQGERHLISQSIAELAKYARDLDIGFGRPQVRFWFSPNHRYPFVVAEGKESSTLAEHNPLSLQDLIAAVVLAKPIGLHWGKVQKVILTDEVPA